MKTRIGQAAAATMLLWAALGLAQAKGAPLETPDARTQAFETTGAAGTSAHAGEPTPEPEPPVAETPSEPPADLSIQPLYLLELTPRAPGLALDRAVTMLVDGKPVELYPDRTISLTVTPGESVTAVLPDGTPLRLEAPLTAFARTGTTAGGIDFLPELSDFEPGEPLPDGTPTRVARAELVLAAVARMPSIQFPLQESALQVGERTRQEIVLSNASLAPQEVELRYLPDTRRFALDDAPSAGYDHRLSDGTLCWLLTLPPASWDAEGTVTPSKLTVAFDRTVLPLPAGDGFATAREPWKLLWQGMTRRGLWRAEMVAPRVRADLTADADAACVGDLLTFTVKLTNRGGAEKRLIVSTPLPRGFCYQPDEAAAPAPEVVGDMLMWKLGVPAAQRTRDGQTVPAMVELRYALRVEDDALGGNEGMRAMDFGGWADGARLPPVRITVSAARISASQTLSARQAAAGELVTLRTVFENHGGAAGRVTWSQTLPQGLIYVPDPEVDTVSSLDAQGRLTWEVEVPAATRQDGGLSDPGVVEREIQFRVADSAAADCTGGLRALTLPAAMDDDPLPAQVLDILCSDITVQVLAERAALTPGALCVMKLQVSNRGRAGAPVVLEAVIPEGFAQAPSRRGAVGPQPALENRRLTWRLDVPPAESAGPSVVEVVYPLLVENLPEDTQYRTVMHRASYTVADGQSREARAARTEITQRRLLTASSGEGWMVAAVSVMFLGAVAVFVLLFLRKASD